MSYTEANFQEGRIIPFFTDTLSWKEGRREEIDKDRWIVPSDLLFFLKSGNASNKKSFDNIIRCYSTEGEFIDDFIDSVLLPKIKSTINAAFILRKEITFKGQVFTLFNEAEVVGAAPNAKELFERNVFKVIQEASFERKFKNIERILNRRPDLTFFINGIYFAYSELKLSMQGQSARNQGREKIVCNFIEAITLSVEHVLNNAGYSLKSMPSWSDISRMTSLVDEIKQNVSVFTKAVHITTIDDSRMYIMNDICKFIPEIYDAMREGVGSSVSIRELRETLPEKIKNDFQKMPDLRNQSVTGSLMTHLESIYSKDLGIFSEVEYFNSYDHTGRLIRPRSAQRTIFHSVIKKVTSIYLDELTPKLSPEKIKIELKKAMPGISDEFLEKEIQKLLKFKNGLDQHSILIQAAAGLGKTNLIVWLAYALTTMFHPAKLNQIKPVQDTLFDVVVVLTDRTELRANIAKDAAKATAIEAKTTSQLVELIKNGQKIVIYNIQKIDGLKRALSEDLKSELGTKRIAFIIDEVHRSQNGELNKETMDLFEACSSAQIAKDKRNLIIGLTATPTEDILAKYGEWKPSCSPADTKNWIPYISYTMNEAIEEGYILDPTRNILTLTDVLEIQDIQGDKSTSRVFTKDVYKNQNRQRLAADQIARIFINITMNAVRPERGRNSGRGMGKAICVESSIPNAIQIFPLVKESLSRFAGKLQDSIPKTATQKTIEMINSQVEAIKNIEVCLLFSDTQTEKCSTYNDGLSEVGIIKKFRCENSAYKNSIMIVVDKLLTGFDEPTLHTIFINKNMSDVGLFQAVCRVNRIHPNKSDCLVVDMSHGNTVSKEIPQVFKKYGEVTTSDFDAQTLQDKLNKSYNDLFINEKSLDINEVFKIWKTWDLNKQSYFPVEFLDKINALFTGSDADLEKAINLWKNATTWLTVFNKLKYLLDFDSQNLVKHKSIDRQRFALLLSKVLYERILEKRDRITSKILFDVVQLGQSIDDESLEDQNEDEKPKKKVKDEVDEKRGTSSIDALDILGDLQRDQEERAKLISKFYGFLIALFHEIDNASKLKNNDSFRKKIRNGEDMSWEERIKLFQDLYIKATSGVGRINLKKLIDNYDRLDENLRNKMSLLESDYTYWVLGQSYLNSNKDIAA